MYSVIPFVDGRWLTCHTKTATPIKSAKVNIATNRLCSIFFIIVTCAPDCELDSLLQAIACITRQMTCIYKRFRLSCEYNTASHLPNQHRRWRRWHYYIGTIPRCFVYIAAKGRECKDFRSFFISRQSCVFMFAKYLLTYYLDEYIFNI